MTVKGKEIGVWGRLNEYDSDDDKKQKERRSCKDKVGTCAKEEKRNFLRKDWSEDGVQRQGGATVGRIRIA